MLQNHPANPCHRCANPCHFAEKPFSIKFVHLLLHRITVDATLKIKAI
jgi:hypothetical protein